MRLSFAGAMTALCVWSGMAHGQAVDQTYSSVLLPPSSQKAYGTGLRPGSRYWDYQANASDPHRFASYSEGDQATPTVADTAADATEDSHSDVAADAVGSGYANNACSGGGYDVGGFGSGAAPAGSGNFDYSKADRGSLQGGCSQGGCSQGDCSCNVSTGHRLDAACYGLDTCARPKWFAGIYGLALDHDDDNRGTVLAVDDTALDLPALSTGMGRTRVDGGAEVRVGRFLNNCSALEAIYWGWYPDTVEANLYTNVTPGNILSEINFNDLEIDDGGAITGVNAFYTNAQRMRLRRSYEAHNVELNFLRLPFAGSSSHARIAFLAGVRYLKLDEGLQFSTDFSSATFGDDLVNEVDYDVDVQNNLIGFQLGAMMDYYLTCRLSGHIDTKMGVYGNKMDLHTCIKNGQMDIANINAGPYAGQLFAVDSNKEDVAFIGEMKAGLGYDITSCWRVSGGYRVVVLSGVALAQSQIPTNFADLASVADINDNDAFILHGAYFGAEYNW